MTAAAQAQQQLDHANYMMVSIFIKCINVLINRNKKRYSRCLITMQMLQTRNSSSNRYRDHLLKSLRVLSKHTNCSNRMKLFSINLQDFNLYVIECMKIFNQKIISRELTQQHPSKQHKLRNKEPISSHNLTLPSIRAVSSLKDSFL